MAVKSYFVMEKIIEDGCEQTMEFASKNKKEQTVWNGFAPIQKWRLPQMPLLSSVHGEL